VNKGVLRSIANNEKGLQAIRLVYETHYNMFGGHGQPSQGSLDEGT